MSTLAAVLIPLLALSIGCATVGAVPRAGQPVLYITIDDVGPELLEASDTPFLDRLASLGVVYDRFVAGPACSNTRAKVETGFYSMRPRNYVGGIYKHTTQTSLEVGPWLLAQRIPNASQSGKWHLCAHSNLMHRAEAGYVSFGGSQANLTEGYYNWDAVVDGQVVAVDEYATDWVTGHAMDEIDAGRQLVAVHYNAAHVPQHAPPGSSESGFQAMLEYLDGAVQELSLHALAAGYAVILLSDNGGTFDGGGKGNLSHQALSTLLVCYGFDRELQQRQVVDCTDVHATIVDAATGTPPVDTDGISLLDTERTRTVAFADHFTGVNHPPGDGWEEMATDGALKVIRKPATGEVIVTDWFDVPSFADPAALIAALDGR